MIQFIEVTNHLGESINLNLRSPEQSGFFIKSISGLGPNKGTINTTEVLSADGSIFNSARVSGRNLVFELGFSDKTETIEAIRQKSYRYFPIKRPVLIKIVTDTRIGTVIGYVESNEPNIFSKQESTIISILCPNAYFSSDEIVQTFFSGNVAEFEFPFENLSLTEKMITFGSLVLDTRQTVYYDGDVNTGVLIRIHFAGSVNDLTIFNVSREETMSISSARLIALTGSDFVFGDEVVISTIKGNKYIHLIRDGEVINIINTLSVAADWFQIGRGDNVFTFTADSGVTNMQFMIEHNILFEGI